MMKSRFFWFIVCITLDGFCLFQLAIRAQLEAEFLCIPLLFIKVPRLFLSHVFLLAQKIVSRCKLIVSVSDQGFDNLGCCPLFHGLSHRIHNLKVDVLVHARLSRWLIGFWEGINEPWMSGDTFNINTFLWVDNQNLL